MIQPPRFTAEDADRANDEWGCNCGPAAIAAICGLTLGEVRRHMGNFEEKGVTNPSLMWDVLHSLKVRRRLVKPPDAWPRYGLARVQWEGPWMRPEVPVKARYGKTHWVGACASDPRNVQIWDINAMAPSGACQGAFGPGWIPVDDWSGVIVPLIVEHVRRADGGWHLTHVVEIEL